MEIRSVACVGSGLIGQGWATVFAAAGLDVTLYDARPDALGEAVPAVRRQLAFLEDNRLLPAGEAAAAAQRLHTAASLAVAVHRADYVQESVFDDYGVKKEIFGELDASAPARALLASSTSGLLMSEIQAVTRRPGRCILVHPFLPVHLIPVVEIAGGDRTARQAVERAAALMRDLGKVPVVLKREVPGFIVNRLQAALLREAVDLVTRGVATAEDVDRAFCLGSGLRDPILGPFLRMHLVADGIENFVERYAGSYGHRWRSMAAWTEMPPGAGEAVVRETRSMEQVRSRNLEETKAWRDRMLVKLLRLLQEEGGNPSMKPDRGRPVTGKGSS